MALTKDVDDLRPPVTLEVESRMPICLDFLLAKLVRWTNVNNFTKRQRVLLRSTSVLFDSPESLESGMSMAGDDQLVVTMNSLIAERDWSVQEAMNVLNDEDMVAVSRSFQNVDLRHPDHNEAQARVGADGVPTQCRSLYSKYLNRPVSEF
ncbi:hypothetical protein E4U46_005832 [Claviceps purpurea]|nr:hypothetical protein E4U46_005832 [Claviceps purpurea]